MKKQEKVFDLKTILTQQSFNRLNNYLCKVDKFGDENADYGCDAFAMIGNSAKPSQACQMFNLLADPEFINLRSDWGDITGQDNELIPDIEDYATGVKNSFAIKKSVDNFGHLDFPLFNNYMSADCSVENIPLQTSWTEQKKLFEKSLGIKIIDNQEFDNFFNYAEKKGSNYIKFGATDNFFKNTAAKVMNSSFSMLNKMFKAVKLEDKFPFKKQLEKNPDAKGKVCFVSKHFKEHDLSHLDKFVAVVDAFTYEKVQTVLDNKNVRDDLKHFDYATRRKVLVSAKLIADWAVCMASDLGKENHKQMDNALRLELNSIIGTLPQDNRNITTAIANVATDLTAEMFKDMKHLNYASIVEHRKDLGIEYVDEFDLGNYATWDVMKLNNPNAINLHHVLFGRTINQNYMLTKDNISFKGYSPAFNSMQQDAEFVDVETQTQIPEQSQQLNVMKSNGKLEEQNHQNMQDDAQSQSKNISRQTTLDEFPDEEPKFVNQQINTVKDEIVGKVVGVIIPNGITIDNIDKVDDKKKEITYFDQNGTKIVCNYIAFDGENYREFVNGQEFGKVLSLDEAEAKVYAKNKDNKFVDYGSFVKLKDLEAYRNFVEESKNSKMDYTSLQKTQPTKITKPTPKSISKPIFGPVMLGYVVPVDVEAEDVIVGTDAFGVPSIAILDKNRKVDKNGVPKFECCNSLLEENGELRIVKHDNTFEPAISGEISIDEDLKVWRKTRDGKENVVGYLIRPNELEAFKEELDKTIERHKREKQREKIKISREKRKFQIAKNEEQRNIVDNNLKIAKYLDKKPTVSSKSDISDVNMKKAKYGFTKSTKMRAPVYSNKNLEKASTQIEMANAKIARRSAQVEKNKYESNIQDENLARTKYLDKKPTVSAQSNIQDVNLKKTKYLDKKPTISSESNIIDKNLKVTKYLDKKPTLAQKSNIKDVDLKQTKYLDKKSTLPPESDIKMANLKKSKYLDKKPTLSPESDINNENLGLANLLKINQKKKRNVCPKYDKERLYQLYANGVLPEINKKKSQSSATNGIMIHEDVKKQKVTKRTSQQEQNPQLFIESSTSTSVPKRKPTRKEMNPELFN